MTLYEKSLRTIELPAILALLADEAVSEAAKDAAAALNPSDDYYEVSSRLAETSAARGMMTQKSAPPLSGVRDVRASVKRADMGGMLSMQELLAVASLLRASAAAVAYASGERDGAAAIDYLFSALRPNRYLEDKISSAILGPDEMADNASPALADIRRHMRLAHERVRGALNKIITSPAYSKALQEPIITVKNNRYVVPVKAEHKAAVPGLTHDISASGATHFIEPLSVVQANNEIRELLAGEEREIDRILTELSARTAASGADILSDFDTLIRLDLIFAKAKLSFKLDAAAPELSRGREITLRRARHPLLEKRTVVPVDIRLGGEFDTLVVTGPNTGGKTVSLKTLGLLCAMAQCGLHIPVSDGSALPVFSRILADIGDEQSIEHSLSTFSSHMTNIVGLLRECGEGALLLFDELGAGTDPTEGAALAVSIIEYARRRGAVIAATTHYSELKLYALTTPGVQNASCEFDVDTLRPTYRLLTGVPGKSNAFAISKRLGLDDGIIEDARGRLNAETASFEEVLESIEAARRQMEAERAETRALLLGAQEDRKKAEQWRSETQKERERAAALARREADAIIEQALKAADNAVAEIMELRKLAAKTGGADEINRLRAEISRGLGEARDSLSEPAPIDDGEEPDRPIKPGDTVRLLSIGVPAQVTDISPDGTLSLLAGVMKVTARRGEVRLVENGEKRKVKEAVSRIEAGLRTDGAKPELDLRGRVTDEAIPELRRFLDSAVLARLGTVTVIHGKGTGALRAAVHECLKRERYVKAFRLGRYGEGEDGVTIVEFK